MRARKPSIADAVNRPIGRGRRTQWWMTCIGLAGWPEDRRLTGRQHFSVFLAAPFETDPDVALSGRRNELSQTVNHRRHRRVVALESAPMNEDRPSVGIQDGQSRHLNCAPDGR